MQNELFDSVVKYLQWSRDVQRKVQVRKSAIFDVMQYLKLATSPQDISAELLTRAAQQVNAVYISSKNGKSAVKFL